MTENTKPIDVWLFWSAVILAACSMIIAGIEAHWAWRNFLLVTLILLLGFIKPILIKWSRKDGKADS